MYTFNDALTKTQNSVTGFGGFFLADIARLMIIIKNGGLYADLDVVPTRAIGSGVGG